MMVTMVVAMVSLFDGEIELEDSRRWYPDLRHVLQDSSGPFGEFFFLAFCY
jgi:hypothetical protein